MIETGAEKMSKSDGNIFQLSEALDRYGREAVVAYLISGHYRQPLAFGPEQMEQAVARSSGCGTSSGSTGAAAGGAGGGLAGATAGRLRRDLPRTPRPRLGWSVRDALADDFNTPRAMAEVFELVGEANGARSTGRCRCRSARRCWSWSGSAPLPSRIRELRPTRREELLVEREEARAAKDFARADEIRDRLAELGWEVRDSADGPELVPKA